MKTSRMQPGFTLVELNIALIFVALLLLAVAATTIYVGSIYQKGMSLKSINQTGRQVVEQLRRDIAQTPSSKITNLTVGDTGRVCLGGVSYVYNTADGLNSDVTTIQLIRDSNREPVRLARIIDPSSAWCANSATLYDIAADASYTELLSIDDTTPLAVYNFSVLSRLTAGEAAKQQSLQQMTIRLGTNGKGTTSSGECLPPTDNAANFDYCSVREFTTLIRTRGDAT